MSNLAEALRIVEEMDYPVFPCRPNDQVVNGKPKNAKSPHTANGFHDASKNLEQIIAWWTQWPDALVGVPTGTVTGILVIDIDPAALDWYTANAERLACGRTHRTPRGFHLLYRMPIMAAGVTIGSNASRIAPGVDLRADGGYIIWWPAHGHQATGDVVDLTPAPADATRFAKQDAAATSNDRQRKTNGHHAADDPVARATLAAQLHSITTAAPGMHDALRDVSAKLVAHGTNPRFATELLTQIAHDDGTPRARERIAEIPGLVAGAVRQGFGPERAEGQSSVIAPPVPMDWAALTGDPPSRTWWVQDWLTPSPILCAGRGGIGKSLLLQALCTGLATGRKYLDDGGRALTCLVWFCEDDHDEIWRRQNAINKHFAVDMPSLNGLHIMPRVGCDNTLLDLDFGRPIFTPLLIELREQVNDLKADVLVLDNMAQMFGGNSNDIHQVTKFVNGVNGLVSDRPFAPIFTGHVSRGQGSEFFGSVAWENAVRMRWFVGSQLPDQPQGEDETVDPDTIYLARRKSNYTAKDYRKLRFSGGLFVPEEGVAGVIVSQTMRDESAERALLKGIRLLAAMGIKPTDGKTSSDYAPQQIIDKGFAQGHTKRELTSAMNRLMGTGRLSRDVIGRYANRMPRMGLVEVVK